MSISTKYETPALQVLEMTQKDVIRTSDKADYGVDSNKIT